MHRHAGLAAAALVGGLIAAGCARTADPGRSAPIATTVSAPATTTAGGSTTLPGSSTVPTGASTTTATGGDGTAAGFFGCRAVELAETGLVERGDLTEASGLVASEVHDGVIWAHNDSGSRAGLFAIGLDGSDRGFFGLTDGGQPVEARDVEDVALVDGTVYLADIGDNEAVRESVTVFVLREPTPGAPGGGTDGSVEVDRRIVVRYPDGPTDAEALLVDPRSGDLVILSKDLDDSTAPTRLYTVPAPLAGLAAADGPAAERIEVEAEASGSLDVADLTRASAAFSLGALAFPGAATGADVTADGSLIALRTYGSVWLFERGPDQSLTDALAGPPCEGGAAAETQGESVGFLPSTDDGQVRYLTVSEGDNQPLNLVTVETTR